MAQKLTGKVAVVTGSSKGIGASIAQHLAREGAAVVVNHRSSKADADRVVSGITRSGGKAIAVQADLAKEADIRRLFAEAEKAFGRLDVLVNNAGIYEFQPLENITAAHFHKHFDLNVLGLILASQEAVKHFNGGGSIINVSSVAATSAPPSASVYSATKAAVDAVTKALAKESRCRSRSPQACARATSSMSRRPGARPRSRPRSSRSMRSSTLRPATPWCAPGSAAPPRRPRRALRFASWSRSGRRAVVVPVSALRKGPEGDQVFVVAAGEDGRDRAHMRRVEGGAMLGDEVVVEAGLAAGERVAASGSFKLREGVLVSDVGSAAWAAR